MRQIRGFARWTGLFLAGLFLLLLLATAVSAILNTRLPTASPNPSQLGPAEKAHASEAFHLRQEVGEDVWPGWGEAGIPLIVYNEEYAFLLNYPADPPDGWLKVPDLEPHGRAWEPVADDLFMERPYYRQQLVNGENPQAFTVRVGDQWAASMPSKEWMKIGLIREIRGDLPGFLRPVFPYSLFVNQLLSSSDHYIALGLHESFHAFQGQQMPEQLAEAEHMTRIEVQYPWEDADLAAAWQTELDLLTAALQTDSPAEQLNLTRQFIQQRQMRRQAANLSAEMVQYEQQREWLEGTAKYVELAVWRAAAADPQYVPVLTGDNDFHEYANDAQQWQREVAQMGRMGDDEGDGRFYYTGWAQATLLDAFMPDWKTRYMNENAALEHLLAQAVLAENHPAP